MVMVSSSGARHVVGMVEGSDPALKSEAVVFTAHWDHLGVGRAVLGDAIYNGAADNATGCALLIELARAWSAQSPKPKRSPATASSPPCSPPASSPVKPPAKRFRTKSA